MNEVEQYLSEQSKPREVELWGRKSIITPAIPEGQIGDGLQIMKFTPIDTRPNYYIIRVDSSYDIDAEDNTDMHEEILQLLEDTFGNTNRCDDDDDTCREFPCLHPDGWGMYPMKNFGMRGNNE